jgi:hypothetical protein
MHRFYLTTAPCPSAQTDRFRNTDYDANIRPSIGVSDGCRRVSTATTRFSADGSLQHSVCMDEQFEKDVALPSRGLTRRPV